MVLLKLSFCCVCLVSQLLLGNWYRYLPHLFPPQGDQSRTLLLQLITASSIQLLEEEEVPASFDEPVLPFPGTKLLPNPDECLQKFLCGIRGGRTMLGGTLINGRQQIGPEALQVLQARSQAQHQPTASSGRARGPAHPRLLSLVKTTAHLTSPPPISAEEGRRGSPSMDAASGATTSQTLSPLKPLRNPELAVVSSVPYLVFPVPLDPCRRCSACSPPRCRDERHNVTWLQATGNHGNARRRYGRKRPPPPATESAASVQVAVLPDARGGRTGLRR
ncbi:unnamed protein product [Gadus morhua 'NCC']